MMDQDTYEQLMQVQISLDELKEKMDYIIDEIDELKERSEKPCGDTQEKSCGNQQIEEKTDNTTKYSTSVSSVPKSLHRGFYVREKVAMRQSSVYQLFRTAA